MALFYFIPMGCRRYIRLEEDCKEIYNEDSTKAFSDIIREAWVKSKKSSENIDEEK